VLKEAESAGRSFGESGRMKKMERDCCSHRALPNNARPNRVEILKLERPKRERGLPRTRKFAASIIEDRFRAASA